MVNMAKRHASLVPLSHDHHHGLALGLRLVQGDNALLNDGWTHDRAAQARMVLDFYNRELRHHFAAEEDALFPAMRRDIPDSSGLIDSLVEQHRVMENIISRLRNADGDELAALLVQLGEVLEQHIRSEERDLFVLYQNHYSDEEANRLGAAISRAHDKSLGENA